MHPDWSAFLPPHQKHSAATEFVLTLKQATKSEKAKWETGSIYTRGNLMQGTIYTGDGGAEKPHRDRGQKQEAGWT